MKGVRSRWLDLCVQKLRDRSGRAGVEGLGSFGAGVAGADLGSRVRSARPADPGSRVRFAGAIGRGSRGRGSGWVRLARGSAGGGGLSSGSFGAGPGGQPRFVLGFVRRRPGAIGFVFPGDWIAGNWLSERELWCRDRWPIAWSGPIPIRYPKGGDSGQRIWDGQRRQVRHIKGIGQGKGVESNRIVRSTATPFRLGSFTPWRPARTSRPCSIRPGAARRA
jgi:hypothetical protein